MQIEGERGRYSWQPTICFQPPVLLSATLSGLLSSPVCPFPPPRKGRFDLINIRLPSRSEKAHYSVEETALARCQGQEGSGRRSERRKEKETRQSGVFCVCVQGGLHLVWEGEYVHVGVCRCAGPVQYLLRPKSTLSCVCKCYYEWQHDSFTVFISGLTNTPEPNSHNS